MGNKSKILINLTIIICVLLLSSALFAEGLEDLRGVKLNNGSNIYGKVIKASVYEVTLVKSNGKEVTVSFDDVLYFLEDADIVQAPVKTKPSGAAIAAKPVPTPLSAPKGSAKGLPTQKPAMVKVAAAKETPQTLEEAKPSSDEAPAENALPEALTHSRHTWEIGPEFSHYKYEEPGLMNLKGPMIGLNASYTYHNDLMIKLDGTFSYALLDYDSNGTGTQSNIDNYIIEVRALGGYDINVTDSLRLTPYIGFGYRYLKDDRDGDRTSTGALGYKRESNYYYSPIGIEAVNTFKKGWSAGLILEYDYFWKGTQENNFGGDIDDGFDNDQDSGYGLRGSIIIKKKTDRAFYVVEPFIRYWKIDKSDNYFFFDNSGNIIGYAWEPRNETTEIGVKFRIGY